MRIAEEARDVIFGFIERLYPWAMPARDNVLVFEYFFHTNAGVVNAPPTNVAPKRRIRMIKEEQAVIEEAIKWGTEGEFFFSQLPPLGEAIKALIESRKRNVTVKVYHDLKVDAN